MRGPFVQAHSGRAFYPSDPRPEDIGIEDIAHSLSLQCRFGGHSTVSYSVADHCIRVSDNVPASDALWGLLHDASEAYLVDVPRPVKALLVGYREIEERVMAAVCVKFGLPIKRPESVHLADEILLATEARDLMKPSRVAWPPMPRPLDERITPRSAEQARVAFLNRFERLSRFVTT